MLSFIIWLPILAAFFLFVAPVRSHRLSKWIALLPCFIILVTAIRILYLTSEFNQNFTFEFQRPWISNFGISYHLGVNRISAILILLTALVGLVSIGVSKVTENAQYFYALALIMIGGLIGAFTSLNLFFLYIFHEFALIPTFILIGIWGAELRRKAAIKITLYLALGSLILLVGLIGIYDAAGIHTFDLPLLKQHLTLSPIDQTSQIWLFGILFLGFGVLIAIVPFHTWAPIGYSEAPTLAAMFHAGVIKKFGLYGLLTIAIPLLPLGFNYWKPWMISLAVGNLIYCGYVAMQQKDLRYMLAYSSISHMGYALLALAAATPLAIHGFILFLFAHGLSAALGFGTAGYCRDQTGSTIIRDLGGLAHKMPTAATFFVIATLASCGLPGFANFPAELMIFLGSFNYYPWATVAALWTVVISAVYMFRAINSVFLGPMSERWVLTQDINFSHKLILALLVVALLAVGFWPKLVLGYLSVKV